MSSAPIPKPQSLYDFPAWYDALHAPGSAAEADLCLRLARQFCSESARGRCTQLRWIEPGCGSGRIIRALAQRGQDAVGIDVSDAMISYARSRSIVPRMAAKSWPSVAKSGKTLSHVSIRTKPSAGRATYVVGDMTKLNSRRLNGLFDAAYCPHNTVRHLPTDDSIVAHLRSMKSILKRGGLYFVGVNLAEAPELFPVETTWSGVRGSLRVQEVMQFEPVQRGRRWVEQCRGVVVIQTRITRGGKKTWKEHATLLTGYDLWCAGTERWRRLVEQAGLSEVAVVDEDGKPSPSRSNVYQIRVLRKM